MARAKRRPCAHCQEDTIQICENEDFSTTGGKILAGVISFGIWNAFDAMLSYWRCGKCGRKQ